MRPARSLPILLCLFSVLISPALSQKTYVQTQTKEQSFINFYPVEESAPRVITLEDILSLRDIQELQISPDGKTVAFIVKQAFIDLNDSRSALFVVKSDGSDPPQKLLEEKEFSQIRWSPDGKFIAYLLSKSGTVQVWKVPPHGGDPEQLSRHATSISQYEWSPDGTRISFVSSDSVGVNEKEQVEAQGVVVDDTLSYFDIRDRSWIKKPQQLWIYDVDQQREERIWEHASTIFETVWSPDALKIAISYRASNEPRGRGNRHIGVISLDSGRLVPLVTWEGNQIGPRWSPDSQFIAFISAGNVITKTSFSIPASSVFIVKLEGGKPERIASSFDVTSFSDITKLQWGADISKIYVERDDRSTSALHEVTWKQGSVRKVSQSMDHLSHFSFNKDQSYVACIRQNTMTPPEVAVINLKDGIPKTLTKLNPGYENIRLGQVSEMKWTNKYGYQTNAFLIKPIDYVEGKHYPFLLILYGFTGKFISQAQWIPNYAAQVFAANGYAVLLMNYPRWKGWRYGDFEQASFDEAYNTFASIQKAVETLVVRGIIDPNRKGIMGWSHGSFLTDFAITHSNLFQVASSGDSGKDNPGHYWMLNGESQYFSEGLFGGPPYGKWYQNWKAISPALNADRVRIPVLLEYAERLPGLEFYTAVRKQGGQAELVLYPNEAHVFYHPKSRLYSMRRNLDWFNFWLQEREDPDPTRADQYKRWRELKKLQEKNASQR